MFAGSPAAVLPPDPNTSWWVIRAGRGLYTRTVSLSLWGRLFVVSVIVQACVVVALNVTVSVVVGDCLTVILLGVSSLTTLFMSYFAVEAVRTENAYQCARASAARPHAPDATPPHRPAHALLPTRCLRARAHRPQALGVRRDDDGVASGLPAPDHRQAGGAGQTGEREREPAAQAAADGISRLRPRPSDVRPRRAPPAAPSARRGRTRARVGMMTKGVCVAE